MNQKKIFVISLAVLCIFLLFRVILLPGYKEILAFKQELVSAQQENQEIEMFLAKAPNKDEAVRLLKLQQQYLSSKFPRKEDETLRLIPELARKNNVELIFLQQGLKTEFRDAADKQRIIEGRVVNYLPVTVELRCAYKDLVKYLQESESDLPAFISITSLNLRKDSQVPGKIRANIGFNLYLLI